MPGRVWKYLPNQEILTNFSLPFVIQYTTSSYWSQSQLTGKVAGCVSSFHNMSYLFKGYNDSLLYSCCGRKIAHSKISQSILEHLHSLQQNDTVWGKIWSSFTDLTIDHLNTSITLQNIALALHFWWLYLVVPVNTLALLSNVRTSYSLFVLHKSIDLLLCSVPVSLPWFLTCCQPSESRPWIVELLLILQSDEVSCLYKGSQKDRRGWYLHTAK